MMYTKSESDSIVSLSSLSSPKPPRPVYYVQSPSRDSQEEDKSSTTASATATLETVTPTGFQSPLEGLTLISFFSRQSRSPATSRVSGLHGYRRKRMERDRVQLLGGRHLAAKEAETRRDVYVNWWRDEEEEELSWGCKVFMWMMCLGLVFMVVCSIVWGASRPYNAQVFLKDVTVHNFYFGEGSDLTGVPSKILTVNCSLRMRVHNPATFFGIHVSCSTINLRYFDLTIASGQLDPYYQPRKSWRTVHVNIEGQKVPLHGAGAGFTAEGVPLILDFEIRSKGQVVGKLVKTKHRRHVRCSLNITAQTTRIVRFTEQSCI
ncbi:uncharacterized protein [Spinacia oleracea]|uniref:Late embryogenesis abundant protein LEA-2 subgroup domain-containing protein n=1 Tax=Spinacia oleracea TaxID=3562 RepID=A0A9R0J6V4_SPIOL|nr:uncharacterized protein LOC110801287 [Spinacia oleracea]